MEPNKQRFTLGRQSSMAPPRQDCDDDSSSTLSLPEKLDMAMQLLFLASKGDEEGIKALISEGADVDIADFDDRTALHVAACEGHARVVNLLVKKGANANARDRWGSTPLSDAKHYGNKEVCEILEKAGARLPESSKKVPMQVANPDDVPEYEVNPADLTFLKRDEQLSTEYRVAKWHGIHVYVKEIPGELSNQPQIVAGFRAELALLQKLRHPNIVQFLGAVTQSTPMRIILEYCVGGDLHGYLLRKRCLEVGKAVVYALDIARGLNYLHEWKPEAIMHRELKPRNILRDRVGRLKVADFHLGQILSGATRVQSNAKRLIGPSRHYMAPEILRGDAFDKSVDVYSFAMILYQMIEGSPPFVDKTEDEVLEAVAYNHERPPFRQKNKHYPEGLKELIVECWDENAHKRPNFTDVIDLLEQIKPLCEKKSFWRRMLRSPKKSLSFRSLSLQ
ncbi:hypothetical protein GOP47_0005907 [Adiantum capillus-veneris]|uniref:Protein kinase domain-containing protein n=1 Tax=Adiantum capillus-veneris TaxID=13818 RepID=A0A9D4ZM28_ADICA|nr:hypothetical protein GOP47_0005907 [Adiantum capillus-veneris]